MSSTVRLHVLAALLAAASLALGGCGFRPLYAVSGVTSKMAAIQVSRPDGRTGYLIGQSLDDELGHDAGEEPVYRLTLQLKETRIPRGININNVATSYEVDLTAVYQLTDIKTKKPVTAGTVSVNATYDAASQPYASLADSLDGERRAAEAAAQRIRLELATYFAAPRPTAPGFDVQGKTTDTFVSDFGAQPVESPRERAVGANGANPGAGDIPDPYGNDLP